MTAPVWNTPIGTVGTFVPGSIISPVVLKATFQAPATSVTYQIINGSLPNGLVLLSIGYIIGTPSLLINDSVFKFVVRATDNLGNIADRGFSITISNVNPEWVTDEGSIGVFPSGVLMSYQLTATPLLPATYVTYTLISGTLPSGLTVSQFGLISGTPTTVALDTSSTFVIRVTDNRGNIRDRTFSMTVTGTAAPAFTIAPGSILTTLDSAWIELPITYSNPIVSNTVSIRILQGSLPDGLEINSTGLIRGYPIAPAYTQSYSAASTIATAITGDQITCYTTVNFSPNRRIVFTGTVFGGIIAGKNYYVKEITSLTTFTISETVNGPAILLTTGTGFMNVSLPAIVTGQPITQTFDFTLELTSPAGNDQAQYSITVTNQNLPISQGGPGYPANTRVPTILNTRPGSYDLTYLPGQFGYYVLPSDSGGLTYPVTTPAYIGQFQSDNYFGFKILGFDFDGNQLTYDYSGLPPGLTGDPSTGWVTGNLSIADNSISEFSFFVAAAKTINPTISSPYVRFSFRVANDVSGNITWLTPQDLGTINNGSVSLLRVSAYTPEGLPLTYVTADTLPPNLTLSTDGEIRGIVAYQPTDEELSLGQEQTYSFSVTAYSLQFPVITTTRTFTVKVSQQFEQPTDTLYIKCSPSIEDRYTLRTLLDQPSDTTDPLIPDSYLYRPDDPNFGKARSVVYAHAYGINASAFDEYVAAVTKNHYWRDLTLGEIRTAQARDQAGNIVYEVVYSAVIDNLVNPDGVSISEEIYWPRPIDLHIGPWYTSITDIFTSYGPIDGIPYYYTSLTSGSARLLYPNSLFNMRSRVGQTLGQEYNSRILPLWMTSQQENGSTLGYVPAWVICYTKPGYAATIKNNIETKWKNEIGQLIVLNQIDFQIDRFYVAKNITYDYEKSFPVCTVLTQNVDLQAEAIYVADTYLFGNQGTIKIGSELISYTYIDRIGNYVTGLTRGINGTIPSIYQIGDEVSVDLSYWANLPSATPAPDPIDSEDFYVLFPRKTILPDNTQY